MNRCEICGCRIMDDEVTCNSFRCMEIAADDVEDDYQPDEAQEWADFDPDC